MAGPAPLGRFFSPLQAAGCSSTRAPPSCPPSVSFRSRPPPLVVVLLCLAFVAPLHPPAATPPAAGGPPPCCRPSPPPPVRCPRLPCGCLLTVAVLPPPPPPQLLPACPRRPLATAPRPLAPLPPPVGRSRLPAAAVATSPYPSHRGRLHELCAATTAPPPSSRCAVAVAVAAAACCRFCPPCPTPPPLPGRRLLPQCSPADGCRHYRRAPLGVSFPTPAAATASTACPLQRARPVSPRAWRLLHPPQLPLIHVAFDARPPLSF